MPRFKKIIASFLVAFFALSFFPQTTSFAQEGGAFFTDGNGHWGQYYMERIRLECGVMGYLNESGQPTHKFGPNDLITRAQLAKMLTQCHSLDNYIVNGKPFYDVETSMWYASAVAAAKNQGWIQGYPDGSFRPMNLVNRAEASRMIIRSFIAEEEIDNNNGDHTAFYDVPWGKVWFDRDVYYAYDHRWIDGFKNEYGFPTGEFGPAKNMTRAEAAKIIIKIIDELYYDNNPPPVPVPPPSPSPTPNPSPDPWPSPTPTPTPSPWPTPTPTPSPTPTPTPTPPPPTPPGPPPAPVAGHPSLWLTSNDITRLRSWAVASNPVYQNGLRAVAENAKGHMDSGLLSQDVGNYAGNLLYPRETYALLFAFMSLIENDAAVRDDYANRARTLLMYIMNEAAKGVANGQPFRDYRFSHADRAHFWGEAFPLTVDWIYPYLSASDKATIRTVFLRWAQEIVEDGYTHPDLNDPTNIYLNEPGKKKYRFGVNNHFTLWTRNLGLMAMSLDPADDPGGLLRNYLKVATSSWLVRTDHVIRYDINPDGVSGDWPEGWQYTPSGLGNTVHLLLAVHTKCQSDPTVCDVATHGQQINLLENSFFKNVVTAYLHSMSPVPTVLDAISWWGPSYQPAWYGDGNKYYQEHSMKFFGPLGLYYFYKNDTATLDKIRWVELNYGLGGPSKLTQRINSYLSSLSLRNAIFTFMLFDPAKMNPPDPRPATSLTYFGKGTNRLLARTSWDSNGRWFTYKLTWNKIDHQHGDGNMFEFYRKGEWLWKNAIGYGYTAAISGYHNAPTIENDPPTVNNPGSFQNIQWQHGSQWQLMAADDPVLVAKSFTDDFVYLLGDATNLYNSVSGNATDVVHASRSIIWLKPDHIVIYDRAATNKSGKFKRFWLNFQNMPTINGKFVSSKTPGGQNMYVSSLLPTSSSLGIDDTKMNGFGWDEDAEGEIMKYRLRVEATGDPLSVRFLHVLQGADANVAADTATLVQSTAGSNFDGAVFKNMVVLFPLHVGNVISTTTYTVPSTVTKSIITGLTPNASYTLSTQMVNGAKQVTLTSGGASMADAGGVLVVNM